jgi:hypothetical protein
MRGPILSCAFLLAACGPADDDRPLDGGRPLQVSSGPEEDRENAKDPCRRRERGRWHHSAGHCEPMLPQMEMRGVLVTAFEERSYFPGIDSIPDPNHPGRAGTEIELDGEGLIQRIGIEPSSVHGDAISLRFIGRRTRDPWSVDCFGTPSWVFVVDRLIEARYLGPMSPATWLTPEMARARPVTVTVRHRGRWGEEERKAVERCKGGGPAVESLRLEKAIRESHNPAQASPAGKSSAE